MRALLGDVFERAGATTLPPQRRAVGTIYGYDVAPAQFALWINGARIDPATGLATLAAVRQGRRREAARAGGAGALQGDRARRSGRWSRSRSTSAPGAIGNAVALGLDADARRRRPRRDRRA